MGCNNTVPFSPAKVVESPPSADERTPAGCPVCACVLWQTYKPGSSTPWLSKQGFSTGAHIKKSSVWGLQESETAGYAFSYLFISLFTNSRKELKAHELLWRGKVFFFLVLLFRVLAVKR